MAPAAGIDLYWLPLGAGGHSVRLNGRVYEHIVARRDGRRPLALYHSALVVTVDGEGYAIETAPIRRGDDPGRGVVAEGAVGSAVLRPLSVFRYELRCWRGGRIPDVEEAVESPRRLSSAEAAARRLLDLVPSVPMPVWGRDELGTGDMWNSNSVVAWLLAASGLPAETIEPPAGGRAPGWRAGVAVARASPAEAAPSAPGRGRAARPA